MFSSTHLDSPLPVLSFSYLHVPQSICKGTPRCARHKQQQGIFFVLLITLSFSYMLFPSFIDIKCSHSIDWPSSISLGFCQMFIPFERRFNNFCSHFVWVPTVSQSFSEVMGVGRLLFPWLIWVTSPYCRGVLRHLSGCPNQVKLCKEEYDFSQNY